MRRVIAQFAWTMAVVAAIACGDGGFDYEGEAGRPVAVEIDRETPYISAVVDGAGLGRFLLDTGAPFSVLDTDSFARDDGVHSIDLDVFGLAVRGYEVVAFDALPFPMGDRAIDGLLGGDLLCGFALSIDYLDGQAWLDDAWDGRTPDGFGAVVGAAVGIDIDLAGGGRYLVPGDCEGDCGTIDLPSTRVLVDVVADGNTAPFTALVDTGATAVVLSDALIARLGMGGRPRLDGVTVGTAGGVVDGYFTRLGHVTLAGGEPQTSVPALVVPGSELFDAVSADVGRDVDAVIGGTFLRHFLVTFDYPDQRMMLSRYSDPRHIDRDEFVGPGFDFVQSGTTWIVGDVYDNTAAAASGIRSRDAIVALAGQPISGLDDGAVRAIVTQYDVGEVIPIELDRLGSAVTIDVAVEDLLPHYEVP